MNQTQQKIIEMILLNPKMTQVAMAAPIGVALGLAVNMTESEKRDNQIEFEEAVDRALEKTKEAMYFDSKKEILKELCQLEIENDSLTEIIKNTETYRMRYCTEADAFGGFLLPIFRGKEFPKWKI